MRTKPTSAKQRCWRVAAAQPLILPSSVIGSQACLNARAASPARVSDLCSTERPNHRKQRWLPAEGISPGQTGARDVRRTCPRNSRVQRRGEISGTVPGPHLVNPCSLPTSFSCTSHVQTQGDASEGGVTQGLSVWLGVGWQRGLQPSTGLRPFKAQQGEQCPALRTSPCVVWGRLLGKEQL